jgi:hypothetical protein
LNRYCNVVLNIPKKQGRVEISLELRPIYQQGATETEMPLSTTSSNATGGEGD